MEFEEKTSGIIDLNLSSFEQQLKEINTKLGSIARKSQMWDNIEPKIHFLNDKFSKVDENVEELKRYSLNIS